MSPPDFPRRATMPPAPPAGPPGFEARLWALEHEHGTLERALATLTGEVSKLSTVMTTVERTLLIATTEKTAQEKRHDRFMKWVVGVAIGVSVMALGTLAAWVIHLQTAMATVGK